MFILHSPPHAMATRRLSIGSSSLEYDAEIAFVSHTTAQRPRASITSEEFNFSLGECKLRESLAKSDDVHSSGAEEPPTRELEFPGREESTFQPLVAVEHEETGEASVQPLVENEETGEAHLEEGGVVAKGEERKDDPSGSEHTGVGQTTLIVYGPSGHGRSHLVQKLAHTTSSVVALVVRHTTRQRQPNEISGVDFHFVSRKDMTSQIRRGVFLEHTAVKSSKKNKKKKKSHVAEISEELPESSSLVSLTAEETPTKRGDLLGTSRHALQETRRLGRPCVVLNTTTSGAQQLRDAGEEGIYVFLYTGKEPKADSKEMKISPDYAVSIENLERGYRDLQEFVFQQLGIKSRSIPPVEGSQLEAAEEEWNTVPTVEMEEGVGTVAMVTSPVPPQQSTTFSEILAHFQSAKFSRKINATTVTEHQQSRFFSRHKLAKKLHHERSVVLSIAYCQFDDRESLHLLMLQTIYHKLTGSAITCRRFGAHWQDIGFQGVDPIDDLRGVGLLGLTQLLCLVDTPRTLEFSREVYRFSLEKTNPFPFSILSLNLTQMVLAALRDNALSKICNKRDQVFITVNELHIALLLQFFQRWRIGGKSSYIYNVMHLTLAISSFGHHVNFNSYHTCR